MTTSTLPPDPGPPDGVLSSVPDHVLASGPRLLRWLDRAGGLRPSLAAVTAERARRGLREVS